MPERKSTVQNGVSLSAGSRNLTHSSPKVAGPAPNIGEVAYVWLPISKVACHDGRTSRVCAPKDDASAEPMVEDPMRKKSETASTTRGAPIPAPEAFPLSVGVAATISTPSRSVSPAAGRRRITASMKRPSATRPVSTQIRLEFTTARKKRDTTIPPHMRDFTRGANWRKRSAIRESAAPRPAIAPMSAKVPMRFAVAPIEVGEYCATAMNTSCTISMRRNAPMRIR